MKHSRAGFELDDFTLGYIVAALWSSTTDDGEPMDKSHSIEDIDDDTVRKMIADCERFQRENETTLDAAIDSADYRRIPDSTPMETAGHDFWLTRNRHGAGFWDGDYPKTEADKLTAASHGFGEVDLYLGDDGKIHA